METWQYDIILNVSRLFTTNYKDLAHEVVLKVYNKLPTTPEDCKKYIYKAVKNTFLNEQKKRSHISLEWDVEDIKEEHFNAESRLKAFRMREPILGIALELYYLHGGNVLSIEKDMKRKNLRICRQTLTKYIEEAKQKIRKL